MRLLGAEVEGVDVGQPHAEGRDQRGDARLGRAPRRHALPARLGARPASLSADGARVPERDRPRGAAADPRAGRPAARRGGRLRRRRQQRHRHLRRVHRRSRRAADRRRGRRRGASVAGRHAARFAGGAAGVLQGTRTCVLQDADGNIEPTHSVSAGLDYAAVGPEHAWLQATGRAEYTCADDGEALAAFQELARLEGHHAGARIGARHRPRAPRSARQLRRRTRSLLVNLSGRGDKDVQSVEQLLEGGGDGRALTTTFAGLRAAGAHRPGHLRDRRRSRPRAVGRDPPAPRSRRRRRPRGRRAVLRSAGRRAGDPARHRTGAGRRGDAGQACSTCWRRVRPHDPRADRHLQLRQSDTADGPGRLRPAGRAAPAWTAS